MYRRRKQNRYLRNFGHSPNTSVFKPDIVFLLVKDFLIRMKRFYSYLIYFSNSLLVILPRKTEFAKKKLKNSWWVYYLIKKKLETTYLNENTDKVEKCEGAAAIITELEEIIRTKKNIIICFAYQQGKVFKDLKRKRGSLIWLKNSKLINLQ